MLRTTILALTLLALPLAARAENASSPSPYSYSVVAGPLLSLLVGSGAPAGLNLTGGYCLGAEVARVPGHFGFQTGLFYSHEGVDGSLGYSLRLNYLTVPLLLRLNATGPGAKIKPHLFLGPQVGLLVDSSQKRNGVELTEAPGFRAFELGIRGGAGLDLGPITLKAYFTTSLLNILKETGSFCGNLTWGTLIGVRF